MRLYTYLEFFKAYILRKKTDLVSPRFHPVSDIILPRGSMIHYMPKHENDDGPSVSETFIGNYPDEVYIDFQFGFTTILGKSHNVTFNSTPVIKAYRNKHYNYKWLRDLSSVYRKDKKLIVLNHALAQRGNKYTPDRFINYYRAYNNLNMLVDRINENGVNHPERMQYVRFDLPLNMPGYRDLLKDIHNLIKSFSDGKPVANMNFLTSTKAENCYWLMDLILFLTGDYEHSLFGKMEKPVWDNLHFIFTSNSKLLIINVGLVMSWLEPLMKKEGDSIVTASKRIYLGLINLTNNSNFKDSIDAKESDYRGMAGGEEEVEGSGDQPEENVSSGQDQGREDNVEANNPPPTNLADVFRRAEEAKRVEQSASKSTGSTSVPPSVQPVSKRSGIRADEEDLSLNLDTPVIIDQEEGLDWLSPIDDSLLEPAAISEVVSVRKNVFKTPESGIELALEEMANEGSLTVKQQEFYLKKAQSYKSIGMPNGQNMEEFIKVSDEELHDVKGEIKGHFPTVTDKTMLRQRVLDLKVGYAKKIMHKHIAACVLNMQNAGYILTDYQLEQLEDIEGSYQNIKFQLMPVDGKAAVRSTRIPTIDDDGNYLVDGVKSYFQFQRLEKPIRKIAEDKVVLTSHYDKKVNIGRSEFAADNYGATLIKLILLRASQKHLKVSIGTLIDRSVRCPRYFTMLSRKFKSITLLDGDYAGLELNFDTHHLLEKHPDWKVYLKEDIWVIGEYKGKVLTIDEFGVIKQADKVLDGIEELLGVDMKRLPIEYAVVNVNGYRFPAGVVLCYYFGIDELLKVLKTEYRTIPSGQRYKLEPGEYTLKFNDEQLIFDKRDRLSALVFGGMVKLANMSNFSRVDLNKRNIWVPLMGDPKVRPNHFLEMKNMFDLFIDPITKKRLLDMGYSTDFHYLVIDAVRLLMNDFTRHEVEIEEQNIIGYERFVGHLYSEMCKSNRQYKTKAKTGNQTFDLNPEAVITNIITDSSAGSVKDINPFHIAKSQEDYTFGGFKGRDEQTMLKKTRGQLKSYKGIISEANKDNGKVGFVGYLVSDPRIKNYLGEVDTKTESKGSQMLSSIGNLKYGTTLDDPKRSSFASIQASHAVSAKNYTPNIVRTGQDNLFAHRMPDIFSKTAKRKGKVTSVSKEGIVVTYDDGSKDSCQLGLRIGKADGDLYRHELVTDLKEGDEFEEGIVLAWDTEWYEKDMFCPGQVAVKTGHMTRALFIEDQTVYEDSMEFYRGLSDSFESPTPKPITFLVDIDKTIKFKRKVGDAVEFDSILCEISDSYIDDFMTADDDIGEVNKYGIRQIKTPFYGKVVLVQVAYNGNEDDMSETIKALVNEHNKKQAGLAKLLGKGPSTVRIGTGINVKKPSIPYGSVRITFIVESMSTGMISNKYVYGNQMKGTVGYIVNKQMFTEDGRPIPLKFSFKSMFKRMVISLRNKAVVTEFCYGAKDKFIKLYRG